MKGADQKIQTESLKPESPFHSDFKVERYSEFTGDIPEDVLRPIEQKDTEVHYEWKVTSISPLTFKAEVRGTF